MGMETTTERADLPAVIPGQMEIAPRPPTGPGAHCAFDAQHIIPAITETGRKTRHDARYCGQICRQAAWRERRP